MSWNQPPSERELREHLWRDGRDSNPETGIELEDIEASLTGELLDGTTFETCDDIAAIQGRRCGLAGELAVLPPTLQWLRRRRRL